jgi:signal transduction histidine kinase
VPGPEDTSTPDEPQWGEPQHRAGSKGSHAHAGVGSSPLPGDFDDLREIARQREFLSAVCRELQLTTQGLAGHVELLAAESRRPTAYLSQIHRRLRRLATVLADLAEITSSGREEPAPQAESVDLEDAVEDAASVVYTEALRRRQRLVTDVSPEARTLRTNPSTLRRLLVQLLDYAVVATPPGGTVRVSTHSAKDSCLVGVSAAGAPIGEKDLANVFRPFVNLAEGGPISEATMRGLALARRLVQSLGGEIWVEPLAEGGGAFFFTIPQ